MKNKHFIKYHYFNINFDIDLFLFLYYFSYMNYDEWEIRVNRTMMAMEDLANDLNITMAEIEKWEKAGKVPEKAVKHLKFLEEDLG